MSLKKDIKTAEKIIKLGQDLQHSTEDPKLKVICFDGVLKFDYVLRELYKYKGLHVS